MNYYISDEGVVIYKENMDEITKLREIKSWLKGKPLKNTHKDLLRQLINKRIKELEDIDTREQLKEKL